MIIFPTSVCRFLQDETEQDTLVNLYVWLVFMKHNGKNIFVIGIIQLIIKTLICRKLTKQNWVINVSGMC